jgi:hypothetical protein
MNKNIGYVKMILPRVNLSLLMKSRIYLNHMDIEYGYILSMSAEYKMITFINNPIILT